MGKTAGGACVGREGYDDLDYSSVQNERLSNQHEDAMY